MKIYGINSVNTRNIGFERKLTKQEEVDYKNNAIQPALNYLGTEEVAMILHGTCYPEAKKDIGVGSPYGKVASQLIPFEILHGFNSNQLGPVGVINNVQQISPYKSTVSTRNYLFLDFSELTKDKYANILPEEALEVFNKPNQKKHNYAYSDFNEAFANYEYCIKLALNNFEQKVKEKDPTALEMAEDYSDFKYNKGQSLQNEAIFNILAKNYGTDDFSTWKEIDRNLATATETRNAEQIKRLVQIAQRSHNDIETYKFGQFLIEKQVKENTNLRKDLGFKYISDFLVGVSKSDEWANQDIFLKDYRMGCPYGGEYGPQLWNLPVLDPKKLFNSDGSIGPAGKFLKEKLNFALDNFDNVRIDHALGLIDPYIYDKNSIKIIDKKLDMKRFRGDNISNMPEIDPNGNFKRVLNEIILPTMEEHGLYKNDPVWEDLVTETPTFNEIYHHKNHIPGITQLEYRRGENYRHTQNWGLVGSHDSEPATQMIKKDWVRNGDAWNIFYLAGLLNSNPKRASQRDAFCEKIDRNDMDRIKAKFAELFLTCKKVQISFADFFGIDKRYNVAGEENNSNWKLRLNKDYEDSYYENLASEKPTALNMPEILKMAVQAKADFVNVHKAHKQGLNDDEISADNPIKVQNILDNLTKYENILKE